MVFYATFNKIKVTVSFIDRPGYQLTVSPWADIGSLDDNEVDIENVIIWKYKYGFMLYSVEGASWS
jgi:hypothetical protein